MSFSVTIEFDHVYVAYSGIVEALDVIQLSGDQEFITNMRVLEKVVHDFSDAEEVMMDFEDIKNLTLLSNLESNFTENLIGIAIPKDEQSYNRILTLRDGIQSDKWTVLIAHNYPEALSMLRPDEVQE
ncbi:MAG: hypothetical protein ACI808_002559 [Paraglaciecola sp.]|jgi:hypothetical protein